MNKIYNANWFNVFLSFSIKVELTYIFGVQKKQIETKKVTSTGTCESAVAHTVSWWRN